MSQAVQSAECKVQSPEERISAAMDAVEAEGLSNVGRAYMLGQVLASIVVLRPCPARTILLARNMRLAQLAGATFEDGWLEDLSGYQAVGAAWRVR